jgi:putative ABC transport system permease protein
MNQLKTAFQLSIKSFKNNLGRTVFSLLGVMIGVASVILIMALGGGMKEFVLDQVRSFGTDLIEIEISVPKTKHSSRENIQGVAGASRITTFKLEEAQKLSELENIGAWYAGIMDLATISYEDENEQNYMFAVTSGIDQVDEQFEIKKGRMFTQAEAESLSSYVVLGAKLKENLFQNEPAVGKKIKVDGQNFEVIGVLSERGSGGFMDFDKMIYLPIQTMQKKLKGIDYLQFAFYKVRDRDKIDQTMVIMNYLMREYHDIDDPEDDDFVVASLEDAIEIIEDVFAIINILLLVLTSISLIVGGIGITNVMYVTVTERTFEIGLRKALGAKNSDILMQFLLEAILLTLMGGLIGVLIGFGLAKLAEFIVAFYDYNLNFSINFSMIAVGIGFSGTVGLLFGLRPAQKAAKFSPIEALRR